MVPLLGEFIGTAILLLLGNGVVANVVLNKTKGNDSGWNGDSDWAYSWVPVFGPIAGALIAAGIFLLI